MPQRELPGNIPEDIAETTDDTSVVDTPLVNLESRVDPYRANRDLERWLNGGMSSDSILRPDQRGTSDAYDRLPTTPSLPANWKDNARRVGTLIYTNVYDDSGKIIDVNRSWEPVNPHAKDPAQESDK